MLFLSKGEKLKLNNIDNLEQFCFDALDVDTIQLYIWLSHFYADQSYSQNIKSVFFNIIEELEKGIPDQNKTPARIVDEAWGLGSKELYDIDTALVHQVYYANVVTKINQFFVDRIFLLLASEKSTSINTNARLFLTTLEECFTIDPKYTQGKNSFYIDSANYVIFKNQRWIQKNLVEAVCQELRMLFPEVT
jgi:hypothetical protein